MGDRWYNWLQPIKHWPCAQHDRLDCEFETSPVVERMEREAGIIPPAHGDMDEKEVMTIGCLKLQVGRPNVRPVRNRLDSLKTATVNDLFKDHRTACEREQQ